MNENHKLQFLNILKEFLSEASGRVEQVAKHAVHISFPVMPSDKVKFLCSEVKEIFKNEPSMLEIEPKVIVVGDIHGHILDLIRVFDTFGLPDKQKYLFLGDLVDRGEFSIESVIIIFLCKYLYPNNFYLIRGNHEFVQMCDKFGFSSQIADVYNDSEVFDAFIDCFSYIPLSALIGTQFFCVHGGIGPSHCFLQQFKDLKRPIVDFSDSFLEDIVWSDPYINAQCFEKSNYRGSGFLFGKEALEDFLTSNNLKLLIRAHECVTDGFQYLHDDLVLTVFSASNYCGYCANNAAVLVIQDNDTVTPHVFSPLNYLKREDVTYKSSHRLPNKGIKKILSSDTPRVFSRIRIIDTVGKSSDQLIKNERKKKTLRFPRRKTYI
jgi:diadenosine tetraphosphatase ApaH/serine/threonine PP2A family protein phosphatase